MLSIGLMSGTSMDGIDAALLKTDGAGNVLQEMGHASTHYSPEFKILLKTAEYAIRKSAGRMEKAKAIFPEAIKDYLKNELKMSELDVEKTILNNKFTTLEDVIQYSTKLHADAVKKILNEFGYTARQINVVGYHGQTMFHKPSLGISVIVGNGQSLADQVGIPVVNDFRRQDIEAGGQGAPFAPLYHLALAKRDQKIPLAVVNCGGIVNITLIQDDDPASLIAFDTGPGNGLVDRLIRQRTQGRENMDTDAHYGKKGTVNEIVLKLLYEKSVAKEGQNFFSVKPPKALDIGDMELISELDSLSLEDACATLEAFTADTIVKSLDFIKADLPKNWILAGGGWNNPVILLELKNRLNQKIKDVCIQTADEAGWNSQALEAQIFAYLAVRSLKNEPLSFPGTTGVPKPILGGKTYIPRSNL